MLPQEQNETAFGQQQPRTEAPQNVPPVPPVPPIPNTPQKKDRTGLWVTLVVVFVLVVVIGGASIWYVSSNGRAKEKTAYEVLENNDNPQDYKDFLEKYPDSKYADEVKGRLAKIEEMIAKWNSIALSDNVKDFTDFKEAYDNERYGKLCDIKIDSLDYVTAQKQGTPDAFQRYLDLHLDGRYASEASIAQGTLRDQQVSDEEITMITTLLNDFYAGFAEQDESRICNNIAATMTTFLHRKNASKADVLNTINNMFNEHIEACQFVVNRDLQVTRKAANGDFQVSFSVDQHIERDNEGKTFGQYKCNATVSQQMLITSLTMQEISKQ